MIEKKIILKHDKSPFDEIERKIVMKVTVTITLDTKDFNKLNEKIYEIEDKEDLVNAIHELISAV